MNPFFCFWRVASTFAKWNAGNILIKTWAFWERDPVDIGVESWPISALKSPKVRGCWSENRLNILSLNKWKDSIEWKLFVVAFNKLTFFCRAKPNHFPVVVVFKLWFIPTTHRNWTTPHYWIQRLNDSTLYCKRLLFLLFFFLKWLLLHTLFISLSYWVFRHVQ